MEAFLMLMVGVVFGNVAGRMAKRKGRSYLGWFFVVFVFNVIGLLIIHVAYPIDVEESGELRLLTKLERKEERLRKERRIKEAMQARADAE